MECWRWHPTSEVSAATEQRVTHLVSENTVWSRNHGSVEGEKLNFFATEKKECYDEQQLVAVYYISTRDEKVSIFIEMRFKKMK